MKKRLIDANSLKDRISKYEFHSPVDDYKLIGQAVLDNCIPKLIDAEPTVKVIRCSKEKTTGDICFAIKDENGNYYCGLKKWEKQLRKAQLFHSFKYAVAVRDNPNFAAVELKVVRVQISEIDDYNPD